MKRYSVYFLSVLLQMTISSCVVSRQEGNQIQAHLQSIDEALEAQRQGYNTHVADVQKRFEKMESVVISMDKKLGGMLETHALTSVQMDKIVKELQNLRGLVDEAKHQLGETRATVADILARPMSRSSPTPTVTPTSSTRVYPENAQEHYALAKKTYDAGQFGDALTMFDAFLEKHGKAKDLQDNAYYWRGESLLGMAESEQNPTKEKHLKMAVVSFQKVLENPASNKIDGALFKIGMAFERLGFKKEAIIFYEEVTKKHSKSPLLPTVQKRLQELKQKS